jgi:hypothetical protein
VLSYTSRDNTRHKSKCHKTKCHKTKCHKTKCQVICGIGRQR